MWVSVETMRGFVLPTREGVVKEGLRERSSGEGPPSLVRRRESSLKTSIAGVK